MGKTVMKLAGIACAVVLGTASPSAAIRIQKSTNGLDADLPPGPSLVVGSTVTWTYVVTSDTGRTLTNVQVTDDQIGSISCPTSDLSGGGSIVCTATGTVQPGQYVNVATAVGSDATGSQETDTDPSHYFGISGEISLEKSTEGQDADLPPGPTLLVGTTVHWSYTVTNQGTGTLTGITVTDDQLGPITCPQNSLDPGASMTCTASGTVQMGPYANLGSVQALAPGDVTVQDTDPSHYFGSTALIHVEKSTEGQDADTAPGPTLTVGDPVQWTYVVSNQGTEDLFEISVDDDVEGQVACPQSSLMTGESMTCTLTGTVQEGAYENLATVQAQTIEQRIVTDTDPSHYLGEPPLPPPPPPARVPEIPTLDPLALLLLASVLSGAAWIALRGS